MSLLELLTGIRFLGSDAMTVMGVKRYWQKHHPERLRP